MSVDVSDKKFQKCIAYIKNARSNKTTWEKIKYCGTSDEEGLKRFLEERKTNDNWDVDVVEWYELVETTKNVDEVSTFGFIGSPKKEIKPVYCADGSIWQKYKDLLSEKYGFSYSTIQNIEESSNKIIHQLEQSTNQDDPVIGMVVGNVQSGKTANIAAVIAMAADYGYNFFIVLTGMIDKLREQTKTRLLSDLNSDYCNVKLNFIDHLSGQSKYDNKLQNLDLGENSIERYITVCLKNSRRLNDLLGWLNSDGKSKEKLKVLLIDDEVDHAGINTKNIENDEQTKVSRSIKNIVFARDDYDRKNYPYKCMNYIGYTATPYANFLNETGVNTLYPKNFISTLRQSNMYIGPMQIFGIDGINNGLGIVNIINQNDIYLIENRLNNKISDLPESLEEAILWFICTIAIFRFWKLYRPVSMLIHTSQKISSHDNIDASIYSYFNNTNADYLLKKIESVFNKQTKVFTIDDFKLEMPDYKCNEDIKNYPNFEDILPYIKVILSFRTTRIKLDHNDKLYYTEGIHICVDNCQRRELNGDIQMRIIYPDKNDEIMKKTPAFIVIGGATLSRGLTLEGLTTSYFLRTVKQADTLMQMARWFGYKQGFEILSRIWLSSNTVAMFRMLAKLDYDLRNELIDLELKGLTPKDYSPRLNSFPNYKILNITAKNKMQSAIEYNTTFYKMSSETTWFYRDNSKIISNYELTINFLNSLGKTNNQRIKKFKNPFLNNSNKLIWFDVDYKKVINYISELEIPMQAARHQNYNEFINWFGAEFEKNNIGNWTVIAGGLKEINNNFVSLDSGIKINLESRTRFEKNTSDKDYSKFIDINNITQPNDKLMDIDCSNLADFQIEELKSNGLKFSKIREKYASNKNPLLIVYIVDKDSGKGKKYDDYALNNKNYKRLSLFELNLPTHLVGYYLYIPYGKCDEYSNYVCAKLNYEDLNMEEMDIDEIQD